MLDLLLADVSGGMHSGMPSSSIWNHPLSHAKHTVFIRLSAAAFEGDTD